VITLPATRRTARRLAAGALAVAASAAGQAATTNTTFAVSSTVLSVCTVSATALAFGNYSLVQTDATNVVSVTCTFGTAYDVGLNAGGGSGATVATRKMTGPSSQTLNYTLYQDSGRTTVWGNTVGTDTVAGTGSGTAQNLTVYGRVSGAQAAGAGAYTDTVTVTVTY
jgi:spore coat protein U-like protein